MGCDGEGLSLGHGADEDDCELFGRLFIERDFEKPRSVGSAHHPRIDPRRKLWEALLTPHRLRGSGKADTGKAWLGGCAWARDGTRTGGEHRNENGALQVAHGEELREQPNRSVSGERAQRSEVRCTQG